MTVCHKHAAAYTSAHAHRTTPGLCMGAERKQVCHYPRRGPAVQSVVPRNEEGREGAAAQDAGEEISQPAVLVAEWKGA